MATPPTPILNIITNQAFGNRIEALRDLAAAAVDDDVTHYRITKEFQGDSSRLQFRFLYDEDSGCNLYSIDSATLDVHRALRTLNGRQQAVDAVNNVTDAPSESVADASAEQQRAYRVAELLDWAESSDDVGAITAYRHAVWGDGYVLYFINERAGGYSICAIDTAAPMVRLVKNYPEANHEVVYDAFKRW